uniref:LIM zinc-binding domain-containing protein n=1 Tax=Acrobeloides nanus TaxID=290746 RepID=A0A914E5C4_9BILA
MDSLWHRQCFKCKGCDEPVVDGRDYVAALDSSGRPWPLCLDCHFEEKDLRCAKCNQILRESYVEFNGMNMHRSCFMDDEELDEGDEEFDESGKEDDEELDEGSEEPNETSIDEEV